MFKRLTKILLALSLCFFMCGCSSAEANLAKNIDNQIERIEKVIKNVGNVDNDEIILSDVSKKYIKTSKTINKISAPVGYENLYNSCSTAMQNNNELNNLSNQILEVCKLINALTGKLKKNEIKMSKSQINGCKNCLSDITDIANKINVTKYEVSRDCKAVKNSIKDYKSQKDVLSSKYIKLSNSLTNRIAYYKNALNILNQLKCLINGTCEDNQGITNENNDLVSDALLDYVIDKYGNKHQTYCDENGNCFTPQCDQNGNCYMKNQNGDCFGVKYENGNCLYPTCDENGNCKYIYYSCQNPIKQTGFKSDYKQANQQIKNEDDEKCLFKKYDEFGNCYVCDKNGNCRFIQNDAGADKNDNIKNNNYPDNFTTSDVKNFNHISSNSNLDKSKKLINNAANNSYCSDCKNENGCTDCDKPHLQNNLENLEGKSTSGKKIITLPETINDNKINSDNNSNKRISNIDTYKDYTFNPNIDTYKNLSNILEYFEPSTSKLTEKFTQNNI